MITTFYCGSITARKIQSSRINSYFGKEHSLKLQIEELQRYVLIDEWVSLVQFNKSNRSKENTNKIDSVLTQPLLGVTIFTVIMFFIFQAIFSWPVIQWTGLNRVLLHCKEV